MNEVKKTYTCPMCSGLVKYTKTITEWRKDCDNGDDYAIVSDLYECTSCRWVEKRHKFLDE